MRVKQGKLSKRLMISIPIFVICFIIMLLPYDALWRYFAWCNQMLAVFTLWALTVYLARNRRLYVITLIPALFMTAVTITYIFFAPEGFSALTRSMWGTPIPYAVALGIGLGTAVLLLGMFINYLNLIRKNQVLPDPDAL